MFLTNEAIYLLCKFDIIFAFGCRGVDFFGGR